MSQKNLSVQNKTKKIILSHLKDKKILKIFNQFLKSNCISENIAVAVSGGPDSLALAYLAKCFALKKNITLKCYIVNHKLRKNSSSEVLIVKNVLKKIDINCKILNWNGKKPSTNIQSQARDKRYFLLANQCKKDQIKNLLIGHHSDDLLENFLIRIVRGSGLRGLISLSKETKYKNQNLKIIRPILNQNKKDLIYISKKVFKFFVKDPFNINEDFKRTRVRNLLLSLEKEGLDKKKLMLTISNLKDSDKSITFYVDKNLKENVIFFKKKNICILNKNFFNQSHEVIFRSLTNIIQKLGKKYYPVRGKSMNKLIVAISSKLFSKATLGGCIIDRVNETILISKEN
jgi:tRNA(Ile)-lysidine synthase